MAGQAAFYFQVTLHGIVTMLERTRTRRNHHFLPKIQGLMGREGGAPDPSGALSWVLAEQMGQGLRREPCGSCDRAFLPSWLRGLLLRPMLPELAPEGLPTRTRPAAPATVASAGSGPQEPGRG